MTKQNTLFFLLILMILVLFVNPSVFRDMYLSILGRLFLIVVVIYFSSNNTLFGLLAVLLITIGSDMLIRNGMLEGMETMTVTTSAGTTPPITPESTINDLKQKVDETVSADNVGGGLDLETAKESIKPKQSSTIPINRELFSSDDVVPSTKESFTSMYGRF